MLIASVSTKGGCSKSTVATNLACQAARLGLSTLLIDGDLQCSSALWRNTRADNAPAGPDVISMTTNTIHKDLPRIAASYDVCIIDVGGRDNNVLRSAMLACGRGVVRPEGGIVMIPCQPSQLDLWGLADTIEILETARTFTEITAGVLMTQVVNGTLVSRAAQAALDNIDKLLRFETVIHSRVTYKNAIESGFGVVETEPKGRAAAEIVALWNEVVTLNERMKGAAA